MGAAVVVSILLVSVALFVDVCGAIDHLKQRLHGLTPSGRVFSVNNEPFRGYYPRTTAMRKNLVPFDFSIPSGRRAQENSGLQIVRGESEKRSLVNRKMSNLGHGKIFPVFIPVKFDLNRDVLSERSTAAENTQVENSNTPRLIMDKDFNIRFDNPNIVPLTKPLALVLDSSVRSRDDSPNIGKMMIPFPVLVKGRKSFLEQEGFRDYRDDDEVLEHRSNDDDDFFLDNVPTRKPPRILRNPPTKKPSKNGTTTFHTTNDSSYKNIPVEYYNIKNSVDNSSAQSLNSSDQTQEDNFDDSSQDILPPDVYPGKIFAEMYHKIPKYAVESLESQEITSNKKIDDTARIKYSDETVTKRGRIEQRPRVKPSSRSSFGGQLYSATTDLEWVTHANSTKARRLSTEDDPSSRRIIIHDVEERPAMVVETTTVRPKEVKISEQYWRDI